MDVSKIRAFHLDDDSLQNLQGRNFKRFNAATEVFGAITHFEPTLVYVVEQQHPGTQMVRAFYRVSEDWTDIEALFQVIHEGEVIGDEYHMDLFGVDPIVGAPTVSIDVVLIETESGSIYALDGQLVAPVTDLDKQKRQVAEVMESTARYASYLNGSFSARDEAQ